jgi:hypothetical protein
VLVVLTKLADVLRCVFQVVTQILPSVQAMHLDWSREDIAHGVPHPVSYNFVCAT